MIEKAIYNLLSGNTSITDLVSSRIYPLVREQSAALPAITYQIISGVRNYDMGGPNGMVEGRVQINCFADDPLEAAELSAVLRNALNGHKGAVNGAVIECMLLDDENDLPVIEPENEQMNVFAKTMDFYVLYKEN